MNTRDDQMRRIRHVRTSSQLGPSPGPLRAPSPWWRHLAEPPPGHPGGAARQHRGRSRRGLLRLLALPAARDRALEDLAGRALRERVDGPDVLRVLVDGDALLDEVAQLRGADVRADLERDGRSDLLA